VSSAAAPHHRLWRWIMLAYVAGVAVDIAWHVTCDLTTGDRKVELYEWIDGMQASLFWPLDLVAQIALALR
jgi:hypothetical protein